MTDAADVPVGGDAPADAPVLLAFHRGIYEHLWSEHRFQVLAVSNKKAIAACARLGRKPQVLPLLRLLQDCLTSEQADPLEGLLSAYLAVQPRLTRRERWELVAAFLTDIDHGKEMLYTAIRAFNEPALAASRFFLPHSASWKIWDYGDRPGLWLCFGAFQVHLPFSLVRSRILARASDLTDDHFDRLSADLVAGVVKSAYESFPQTVRSELERHALAIPVGDKVWWHPRVPHPLPRQQNAPSATLEIAAAFALERFWDDHPALIPDLPEHWRFQQVFCPELMPEITWASSFSCTAALDLLTTAFATRKTEENT